MSLTLASRAHCFNCCHCREVFAVLKRLRVIKIKVYSWFCHGLSCSVCHVLPCFIRLSCACHALPSFVKVRAKQIMEIRLGRWHGPSAYRTKQGIQNPLYRIDQIREKCQKGPKNKSLKCIFLSLFLTTWRISIYTMQIHAVLCSESWGTHWGVCPPCYFAVRCTAVSSTSLPLSRFVSLLHHLSNVKKYARVCRMSEILSRTYARPPIYQSIYLIWSNLSILANLI